MITSGHTIPVLDHGYVRYIDHMGSDSRIVETARVSYKLPSKGEEQNKKLLAYLWKNKHTSPFEMCKLTLNIKMPIFVMRQYVRHRMQNLNEVSARYTELQDEFYVPYKWRKQSDKNKQSSITDEEWLNGNGIDTSGEKFRARAYYLTQLAEISYKQSMWTYKELLSQGVAKELARIVLPVGIYTEIYACWDIKNLLHFITLRDDPHAQFEIQEYGRAIKQICKELFPWTMEAYEKYKWTLTEV